MPSTGVAIAGTPINPASISTAGIESPPRPAAPTVSAASKHDRGSRTEPVNTTAQGRLAEHGPPIRCASVRRRRSGAECRPARSRHRSPSRHPSPAPARYRQDNALLGIEAERKARRGVAARSIGGKRSGGTPFGTTRILWRPTPKVSCKVSADPDQSATPRGWRHSSAARTRRRRAAEPAQNVDSLIWR